MSEREQITVIHQEHRKLLDCTLRDGGYINGWRFGRDNIRNIFRHLAAAGVDFIEIGFLDERVAGDPDRSILPDTWAADRLLGDLEPGGSRTLVMIDYGSCRLNRIAPCRECCLDGIRVMFRKQLRRPALDFCGELKARGYQVFAQPVAVTGYAEEELEDLIRRTRDAAPDAISVVDTYGLLHQNDLGRYIDRLDAVLPPGIGLGYHGHNNLQMGYANCISVLNRSRRRSIHVDGSLYGMGKRAGNAPTELIAMYMNERFGQGYDLGELLEAIESSVADFYRQPPWGYDLRYFLAACTGCHPRYVEYFAGERKLPLRDIGRILKGLPEERKLQFDEACARDLCRSLRKG